MIVSALMSLVYFLISKMLSPIHIPAAPEEFFAGLLKIVDFLESGKPFFNLVFPINMSVFFNMFIAIWGFQHVYNLAMWIIKKIPLLGIK